MRGDSLRDLYAKTLAVVGLGVLAGVGALLDILPTALPVGPVNRVLVLPETPAVVQIPAAVEVRQPLPVRPGRARGLAPVGTQAQALQTVPAYAASNLAVQIDPAPPTLPADVETPLMVLASTANDRAIVALEEPGWLSVADDEAGPADQFEDASSASPWGQSMGLESRAGGAESGFLSGALKKTRSSIARVGALTGGSIVGAVRVVGGAARRALPN